MKRFIAVVLSLLLVLGVFAGCGTQEKKEAEVKKPENPIIRLATTTSTKDSGLLDVLLPVFEEETGYEVEVLSMGTGKAIKTGELGDADVILVHARAAEDKFVSDGFGVNRKDVMYNDFVIVGSPDDPAGIKGLGVSKALAKIVESKKTFVSRGDNSGTNKKEMELWKKAGIKPEGDWYQAVNKGMGDTLNMTNEEKAYTLADRGTYIKMEENIELVVLVEGSKVLFNPYGIIAVNPEKHPDVNNKGAMSLIEFITSEKAKDLIDGYTLKGKQLFHANR